MLYYEKNSSNVMKNITKKFSKVCVAISKNTAKELKTWIKYIKKNEDEILDSVHDYRDSKKVLS